MCMIPRLKPIPPIIPRLATVPAVLARLIGILRLKPPPVFPVADEASFGVVLPMGKSCGREFEGFHRQTVGDAPVLFVGGHDVSYGIALLLFRIQVVSNLILAPGHFSRSSRLALKSASPLTYIAF